jgi:hypothetical protein
MVETLPVGGGPQLLIGTPAVLVSHGCCPDCLDRELARRPRRPEPAAQAWMSESTISLTISSTTASSSASPRAACDSALSMP